jgi:hypothetical protein
MTESEFSTDTPRVETAELWALWNDEELAYTGIARLVRLIKRISKDGTNRGG